MKDILFALAAVVFALLAFGILIRTKSMWILNGWMIAGTIIGFVICMSAQNLVRVANHKGPGIIWGGENNDEASKVSEAQYKRENFTNNGVMLGVSVMLWCWVAKRARDERGVRASDSSSSWQASS